MMEPRLTEEELLMALQAVLKPEDHANAKAAIAGLLERKRMSLRYHHVILRAIHAAHLVDGLSVFAAILTIRETLPK